MSTATQASELHRIYQSVQTAADNAWEDVLLENSRSVSTPLATRMLSQMGLGKDTNTPFRLLENACGAGVVAPLLQQIIRPEVLKQSSILCGDFSDPLVRLARKRIESEGWVNTKATKIDAQKTGLADGAFTHVATNIGFHVVPNSEAALNEAIRMLEPGGVLGFTTFHREPGWVTELKEAFESFSFKAPLEMTLQTTAWGRWSDVNWIRETLVGRGLQDVKVDVFAFLSHVGSADAFIANYGTMIDWVMNTSWSEELRREHPREEVHVLIKGFLEKKYGGAGWQLSWIPIVATGRVVSNARI
ncbi:hypothetical protein NEMBOFW57_006944 [Staphylotrichum longicolle]|uniref:Methyltransferase domain-containing protein n=1 Tax=Staphylotrichum longicolle TaxID=669026 RepID=A0AAD4I007_9PEZI|nr:hypothetical protein NEMBOFW57_006944 [Staphylotrichum longicolle]